MTHFDRLKSKLLPLPNKLKGFNKWLVPVFILIILALNIYFWALLQKMEKNNTDSVDYAGYIANLERLTGVSKLGSAHEHIDLKIMLDGKQLDLSQPQYQLKNKFIHVEDGNGDVVHKHAKGVTLSMFFRTIGIPFNSNCITASENNYCNTNNKGLRMYVNGNPNNAYGEYEPKDLDKILIIYGNESQDEINEQIVMLK